MLRNLHSAAKVLGLFGRNGTGRFGFSTATLKNNDPFYILGVERTTDYEKIKEMYFKLAAEFHPDRNKAPDATKRFIAIKEAFELIKQMKGKAVHQETIRSASSRASGFESVRPNPNQYNEDFNEDQARRDASMGSGDRDYYEAMHKAGTDEEFSAFRESLKTMHDIKDIKFRPDDGDVPDASRRFSLDDRVKLKNFNDNSYYFMVPVVAVFAIMFYFMNISFNKMTEGTFDRILYNLLNKAEQEPETVVTKEQLMQNIKSDNKGRKEFQEFETKLEQKRQIASIKRESIAPSIKKFVSVDVNEGTATYQ